MATDYFLLIDGIEGESTDSKHAKEIQLESWSWGATSPNSVVTGGAGAPDLQDFNFVARTSKASPRLFHSLVSGKYHAKAKLTARRAGSTQVEFLYITLTDVLISSYQVSGIAAQNAPMEQVSLDWARVEMSYTPVDPATGKALTPVVATYDRKTNKAGSS